MLMKRIQMGQYFTQETYSSADFSEFNRRLHQQLEELKHTLNTPNFSSGQASIGAELEMYLIDKNGLPIAENVNLLRKMNHPQLTEELNQYNLEYNLSPVVAAGKPFTTMSKELISVLDRLDNEAHKLDTRIVPIGILPTLKEQHLDRVFLTELPRYRALTKQLSTPDGSPFSVDINGKDSLQLLTDDVILEGANTSFQTHFKVPADQFANLYNAAQLITPLVLALAGNSPTCMGKRLWQETRIALFKQSIDSRIMSDQSWRRPPRVCFGQGWVRQGAWELFAENVHLFKPLLPVLSQDNEDFFELGMHHGTVWSWNRPVFEPKHGGHLRIEYRAFPAGPTVVDMMANAALAIGLTQALSGDIENYLSKLPFHYAEYNFYRTAQHGLDAKIIWPQEKQSQLCECDISTVIEQILPKAAQGLADLNLDSAEINYYLSVVEARLANGQTGAKWQFNSLEKYKLKYSSEDSLNLMLNDYIQNMRSGEPVSTWQY
ncbi:glutamate--cysteine ligase [Aliiglaciecola sp.]|nr:glutamate--cysteine ligase [Aliiglaciecola sp.]